MLALLLPNTLTQKWHAAISQRAPEIPILAYPDPLQADQVIKNYHRVMRGEAMINWVDRQRGY